MKIHALFALRSALFRRFVTAVSAAAVLAFVSGAAPAAGQSSSADTVAVKLHVLTPHLAAYAQVEPISVLPVDAAEAGVVQGLEILPGAYVRRGQQLAHLSGPALRAMLLQSEADVRSARSQLSAAQKTLSIEREQLPSHLTTRQAVHQAQSAEVQAQTTLNNAQSHLASVRQMMTVTAPTSGLVLALNSANGQLVSTGQPVVTLQPASGLWLTASYYGADLSIIRVGMTGSFAPSDGSAPIAVRVCSVPGTLTPGGGESIALLPLGPHAAWLSGEAGTVTLNLPQQKLIAVPTRALILNQGKWWVMVRSARGAHPRQVVPGPVQGWNTFIESGLAPGDKVVVVNAYLLFHASIAEQFQIPD
jgi:RND family efflux transporter MFP subunit